MMKKILVTGADGRIGLTLMSGLSRKYAMQGLSLADGIDLRDATQRRAALEKHRDCIAVVHLAWQYDEGEAAGAGTYASNLLINEGVLHEAKTLEIPKVILASSVHADYFYDHKAGQPEIKVNPQPKGNGPYGCAKVMVEKQAMALAGTDFHVSVLRYGAVTTDGQPHSSDVWERRVWLSPMDLCHLVARIVEAPVSMLPEYTVMYAVSNNQGRVHDVSNPYGWFPREGCQELV